MNDVTHILSAIEQGDPQAAERLLPLVYDELRKLAARRLAQEKPGQTLQATALVHDAYLRLVGSGDARRWDSRGHFFAAAAEAMRRILVERGAAQAGDQARRPPRIGGTWKPPRSNAPASRVDVLELDEALASAGRARPGGGGAGEAPLLRRDDHAGGGRGAGPLGADCRTRLDLRPLVPAERARGWGRVTAARNFSEIPGGLSRSNTH